MTTQSASALALSGPWSDGRRQRSPGGPGPTNPLDAVRSIENAGDRRTLRPDVQRRAWTALAAEVEVFTSAAPVRRLDQSERPRLAVVLEEVGGRLVVGAGQGAGRPDVDHIMDFAPARSAWSVTSAMVRYARLITFDIDPSALPRLFGDAPTPELPVSARRSFHDPRILGLARLFETECQAIDGCALYGDSLSIGLTVLLADMDRARPRRQMNGGLTPRQLRAVTEFMEANLRHNISVAELAELTGLSPSHFCRMFKSVTGAPPHRWLNRLRIRQVKVLLLKGEPLAQIALAAGFSDQSHLTRVFSRLEGVSPSAWRRERRGC